MLRNYSVQRIEYVDIPFIRIRRYPVPHFSGDNWRAGASQPSRLNGNFFLLGGRTVHPPRACADTF